jgi:alpha-acetolactate decarboxylase
MFLSIEVRWDSGNIWGHEGDDTYYYHTLFFDEQGNYTSSHITYFINDETYIDISNFDELKWLMDDSFLESDYPKKLKYKNLKNIIENLKNNCQYD